MKSLLNEIIGHGVCAVLYGRERGPDPTSKLYIPYKINLSKIGPFPQQTKIILGSPSLKKSGSAHVRFTCNEANPIIIEIENVI